MKKLKSLSLVLSGVIIGIGISFSPQIYAGSSKLLGSKVTKTLSVKIDNKKIGEAAVIGGTSYIPLRVAANELGVGVSSVDSKEIGLVSEIAKNEQAQLDKEAEEQNQKNAQKQELTRQIEELKTNISYYDKQITTLETEIEENKSMFTGDPNGDRLFQSIEDSKRKELSTIQTNIKSMQQQLTELEAQLAAL